MSSNGQFKIAWAQDADTVPLIPLLTALYKHDVPEAAEPPSETIAAHIGRLLDHSTPHKLAIAWSADGLAIGLAAAARLVSISDPRPDRWTQMELKELFVLPDYRGAGVGAALLEWIADDGASDGVFRMDWHVKKDNYRGIEFYRRHGAHIVTNRVSMRKLLK